MPPTPSQSPTPTPSRSPETIVADLEQRARVTRTPCGEGTMEWRSFGEGPPVALFHGGHGSWLHFVRVIEPLAALHTVHVPDLPGFGASDDAPSAPREGVALADAVAEPTIAGLLTLVGDAPVALVGFSFGGVVAARIAMRLGPQAAALVLIGAPGLGFSVGERPPVRKVKSVSPEALAEVHRANLAAVMIADPAAIDDLAVHIQALNVPRARTLSRLASRSTAVVDALPHVSAPLTAIYGEADVIAPEHEARDAVLRRTHPDLAHHVLPGVGHWAQYEGAEPVARHLLEALCAMRGSPTR